MYVVEIEQDKYESLSENVEGALKYIGKVMHCMEALREQALEEEDSKASMVGYRMRDEYERPLYRRTGRYTRY